MHFIFIMLLFNGRISSLGSILSHWRLNLFNGRILIPLEAHTFPSKTLEQVETPNRSISCLIHEQNNNVPFFFILLSTSLNFLMGGGGLVLGRLLIWGDAMYLRARIRSFKPPELFYLFITILNLIRIALSLNCV